MIMTTMKMVNWWENKDDDDDDDDDDRTTTMTVCMVLMKSRTIGTTIKMMTNNDD